MATRDGRAVLGEVRTLFGVGAVGTLTDGQLLERFTTARGEVAELAFAALVERHGPLVRGVCRSVLGDDHDAADAFQATFLVLVRRARGLWVRDSIGPWLHQVAYRTALAARSAAARRRRHERGAAAVERSQPARADDDLRRLLHEEIERLPDQFRVPLVLCDLEGRSHEQAARHLGWPVGTVKSRQARGRERLRERLRRRGVGPDAALLAVAPRLIRPEGPIPPSVVQSTAAAAVRAFGGRTLGVGIAASLARGVLQTMILSQWMKIGPAVLALGLTTAGVGLATQQGGQDEGQTKAAAARDDDPKKPAADAAVAAAAPRADDPKKPAADRAVVAAERGPVRPTVGAPGFIRAGHEVRIINEVEGQTTLIKIVPEGTRVQQGQVVAELDSATLRDQLTTQEITVKRAEADYENARKTREIAEIGVQEYIEGTYPRKMLELEEEYVATAGIMKAVQERLERTREARDRIHNLGELTTPADILARLQVEDRYSEAEQVIAKQKAVLRTVKEQIRVLEKYTKPRVETELRAQVEKAKSEELAKLATYKREGFQAGRLRRQIEKCTLRAPTDGTVVYADGTTPPSGRPMIEEGAIVRERQVIFSIPALGGPMQVDAKVREARVDQVKPGQKVKVRVDALPDRELTGVVKAVAPLPDPTSYFDAKIKVYTTLVEIDDPPAELRPGMTGRALIDLGRSREALRLPVSAVVQHGGSQTFVAVKGVRGFEQRRVNIGDTDGEFVEIRGGLEPGESVARDPNAVLPGPES